MGWALGSIGRAQGGVCASAYKNAPGARTRVLILRPKIKIWKDAGFSRSESEGASEAVQAGFHEVLSQTFADNGYTLRFDPAAVAEWEETPPNDGAIKALEGHYNSVVPSPGTPNCKTLLETSLEIDLKKIADSNQFDALVLARANGDEQTKTGKVVGAIGMAGTGSSLSFNIGIVNVATGVLVYYCESTANGDYMDAPDSRLSEPIRKCLKQFFSGSPKH
jgi:hypothetical protein